MLSLQGSRARPGVLTLVPLVLSWVLTSFSIKDTRSEKVVRPCGGHLAALSPGAVSVSHFSVCPQWRDAAHLVTSEQNGLPATLGLTLGKVCHVGDQDKFPYADQPRTTLTFRALITSELQCKWPPAWALMEACWGTEGLSVGEQHSWHRHGWYPCPCGAKAVASRKR